MVALGVRIYDGFGLVCVESLVTPNCNFGPYEGPRTCSTYGTYTVSIVLPSTVTNGNKLKNLWLLATMWSTLASAAARAPLPSATRALASSSCWRSASFAAANVPSSVSSAASQQPQAYYSHVASAAAAAAAPTNVSSGVGGIRSYSTTNPSLSLDEFRDSVPRLQRMKAHVGRQWTVRELRRKSFDDLHKLWWVLYKEKNMLLTEKYLCERGNLKFPQPFRYTKVKRSMKAIRVVLGERKRERNAQKQAAKAAAEAEAGAMDTDEDERKVA